MRSWALCREEGRITLCQNLFLIIDSSEEPSSKFSFRNQVCLKIKKKKKESFHYKFIKERFGYQTMTSRNYVSIIHTPRGCIILLLSHLSVIKSGQWCVITKWIHHLNISIVLRRVQGNFPWLQIDLCSEKNYLKCLEDHLYYIVGPKLLISQFTCIVNILLEYNMHIKMYRS